MPGFRERVLAVVREVPRGTVVTYGQVAAMAGAYRAARQVGAVLFGLREEETDVPWHRVVNASGGISTYKVGSGELQVALLRAEGVPVVTGGRDEHERVDLARYRWRPLDSEPQEPEGSVPARGSADQHRLAEVVDDDPAHDAAR